MIRLENILTPGRSLVSVPGGSKKRVLEQIASLVATELAELDEQDIFESLIAREKLGWQPQYADLATIIEHAWKWETRGG